MKKIITTPIIVFVGMLLGSQLAFASNAVLSVSPISETIISGSTMDIVVKIEPTGNNVCVVKGTINFAGLSCQNITVVNGVMSQTVPTCTEPNFTVGIPKCTLTSQNLFSVSVKGGQVGQGSLSFSNVKVIGAGTDIASDSISGAYNIIAAPQLVKEKVVTPKEDNQIKVNTIPDTGLQVPKGVGQFASTNTLEQVVSTTTSTSAASLAEKKNSLIATAYEGITNISERTINVLLLIVIAMMAGWIFYLKNYENKSNIQ